MTFERFPRLCGFLVMLLLLDGTAQGCDCPIGFKLLGKSCYWFSHRAVKWWDAITICRQFDSHLAKITSEAENILLKNYAKRKGKAERYWLGGSDLRKEGTWTWEHPVRKFEFTDWHVQTGQPDNGSGTEHCLELKKGYGYHWNDQQCYVESNFICEKAA